MLQGEEGSGIQPQHTAHLFKVIIILGGGYHYPYFIQEGAELRGTPLLAQYFIELRSGGTRI